MKKINLKGLDVKMTQDQMKVVLGGSGTSYAPGGDENPRKPWICW